MSPFEAVASRGGIETALRFNPAGRLWLAGLLGSMHLRHLSRGHSKVRVRGHVHKQPAFDDANDGLDILPVGRLCL